MKKTLPGICIVILLFLSCNSDEVSCEDINLSETLAAEIDSNTQALTSYALDPSDENCIALKESYQEILDALQSYEECAFNSDDELEYNNFVQTAEMGISLLTC